MNKKFKKHLSSIAVAAMLVGAAPAYVLADEAVVISAPEVEAASTIVHFVNSAKPSSISAMATYISNAKTYVKDGTTYLRMDVQQVYDVNITVEGQAGTKVGEYKATVQGRGGAQEVTFFTLDYALKDATATIEAEASYFVPNVFTEPQKHGLYVVIGNDIDKAMTELQGAIATAAAIEAKTTELTAALAEAEKVNSYLTKKADLEAALTALNSAIAANPAATPVHYVHETDASKLSVMGTYLANAKTYVKDGVSYLRVDVQQSYDVKVTVEGKEGTKVAEYVTTVAGRGGPQEVTMFTFDYVVPSFEEVITAEASYFVPGVFTEPQQHAIRVVLGEDVTGSISKLVGSLAIAEAVENPAAELTTAIEAAKQSNSYLLTNTEIEAARNELVAAIAGNVSFTDTPAHWAKADIHEAVAYGIVNGYTDGTFQPNKLVTRGEFTKLIATAFELPAAKTELSFKDADSIQAWAVPYVQQATEAGIISGYNDETFRADKQISRAEMAVMVVKALKLELVAAEELTFADQDAIPAYAKTYVATAVKHGLIEGLGNNRFGAADPATRAQAVTIIMRAAK